MEGISLFFELVFTLFGLSDFMWYGSCLCSFLHFARDKIEMNIW